MNVPGGCSQDKVFSSAGGWLKKAAASVPFMLLQSRNEALCSLILRPRLEVDTNEDKKDCARNKIQYVLVAKREATREGSERR